MTSSGLVSLLRTSQGRHPTESSTKIFMIFLVSTWFFNVVSVGFIKPFFSDGSIISFAKIARAQWFFLASAWFIGAVLATSVDSPIDFFCVDMFLWWGVFLSDNCSFWGLGGHVCTWLQFAEQWILVILLRKPSMYVKLLHGQLNKLLGSFMATLSMACLT